MKKPISREEALQILSKHDVVKIEMYKDGITYNLKPIQRTCLNDLRDAIYEDAVAHGLWERTDNIVQRIIEEYKLLEMYIQRRRVPDRDELMRECAARVIQDEMMELKFSSDKKEAYVEKLADVIISSLSVAGKLGIDIDAAVRRKMEINRSRPWKHGKEDQGNA